MTLEILKTKEELRDLIDAYAYLGDDKKISEQMQLFTKDATYKVYMNGVLVANTTGTDVLEKEFSGHAAQVKTYFTLNGQHTVKIDGDKATGVSFTQIKMVRENEGKDNITDYSVKYEDIYVLQEGKWLISERIGHFLILEERSLNA
ncbi:MULTISPECIES: nuclear transport factor 2 family protein [Chryseobacterium]|uniref:nuclear transport factor 2 family protein n=1 Tax=Chryseobacterium TaxID=59732 RepID=UPI001626773A|nr:MULTISPECIES: nuclear transport factor 2 family protein [Chryseobacterium]MBF6643883.1 nuclear transport factor 2 family protein [Chryseobacterium indologenes]MBU3047158.1 nuclear transport factor 2 family protein [Chryseobacterium indologenes]QQQ72390.1 nuclear transport factor 2 family protein [Chryseobacterium indologenes]WET50784.1 nuclear transport factor 2 family protein [Chryseobacterium indologenes]